MIEPLDFSKYEVPEFPHFFTENQLEAITEWLQINDSVTKAFRADLEDYLMNYLAIELGEESIHLSKIRKLVEIAMDYVEDYDEVVNIAVKMLPLLQADKLC
jgi:uncharacterized protein (DUF952 family)